MDVAATAAEAIGKMDDTRYDLVLSDLRMESEDAGLKVLAHARMKEYKPATALIRSELESTPTGRPSEMLVKTEGVPTLLAEVAELLGERASRRVARNLRLAAACQPTG